MTVVSKSRTVASAIKEFREVYQDNQGNPPGQNLTQQMLAHLIGVTHVTINHWLNKVVANVQTRQFRNLCKFLDNAKDKEWLKSKIQKESIR